MDMDLEPFFDSKISRPGREMIFVFYKIDWFKGTSPITLKTFI